jgi:single-stranded-DNA-specific exonuclease
LTASQIKDILNQRIKDDLFTKLKDMPKPDSFKDIDKATKRIIQAINQKQTINLVGDYDADGICSTAIMVLFFRYLGVELNHIIPNRFDHGYGLSPKILDLIDDGLIITVDNGISAIEAANICKIRGLDLIITDHHTVGDSLPEAFAIINPKQDKCNFPFSEICGAQVAWYLCANIKKELKLDYNLLDLFDILTIAIVADIMPMIDLNKTMVKTGLKSLSNSNRPAIEAFRQRYGLQNINEEDIGFRLAPLINCAGRMGDPNVALEFLLSQNSFEANEKLDFLVELNEQRKEDQLKIFQEAKTQVDPNDDVILVSSANWNEGIVGIVASKLCDKYKKPALVFSQKQTTSKASARSTSAVDLYNLIASCSDILLGFGGHKQAAGLSVETKNLNKLKTMLNQNIHFLPKEPEDTSSNAIGTIDLSNVGYEVYNLIESYRPFGQANPYPIFEFKDLKVLSITKMGKNKEFTKLIVSNNNIEVEVVIFNDIDQIDQNSTISFTGTISKNEFRGNVKYNILLKDLL